MLNLNKYLTDTSVIGESELMPVLSPRKSFYHKARVAELSSGAFVLLSYGAIAAMVTPSGAFYINGKYSQTTTAHQKDFAYQYGSLNLSAKELDKYQAEFRENLAVPVNA